MAGIDLDSFPPLVQWVIAALVSVGGACTYIFARARKDAPTIAPQTVVAPSGVSFNVQILQDAIDALKAEARYNEERDRMMRAVASNIVRLLEVIESTNRLTRELVEVQVRLERRYQEDLQRRHDREHP